MSKQAYRHPYYLNAMGMCCALGASKEDVAAALFDDGQTDDDLMTYLKRDVTMLQNGQSCYLGHVDAKLPDMPKGFERYNSRNNRMLLLVLNQIKSEVETMISRYGSDRVAVVLGTSTSGINDGEKAFFAYEDAGEFPEGYNFGVQEIADGSEFWAAYLGVSNMAVTISTACSSSAKVFQHAAELMEAGLCDAAIVGGMDSLCHMTCGGFHSLGALSDDHCNPFSKNRKGISIGEGGALFVMTREPSPVRLMSVGESSDGYSMTAPEPDGKGAETAMRSALDLAGVSPSDIAYVNLHGTSTLHNDSMESKAVSRVFGNDIACSSSKSIIGHTLGAAGAVETALCWIMMDHTLNPQQKYLPHLWDGQAGEDVTLTHFTKVGERMNDDVGDMMILSNFCAFGGSNASVVLKREEASSR